MTPLEEFCSTLTQLIKTVKTITAIEQGRVEAASQNQHQKIQACLNEEQAALLSLRGLEQKRMRQADALGWNGLTFQQILEAASPEQEAVLRPLFVELNESVSLLKEIRESADRIVKLRIHEFEEAIAAAGGTPDSQHSHFINNTFA